MVSFMIFQSYMNIGKNMYASMDTSTGMQKFT